MGASVLYIFSLSFFFFCYSFQIFPAKFTIFLILLVLLLINRLHVLKKCYLISCETLASECVCVFARLCHVCKKVTSRNPRTQLRACQAGVKGAHKPTPTPHYYHHHEHLHKQAPAHRGTRLRQTYAEVCRRTRVCVQLGVRARSASHVLKYGSHISLRSQHL